jgi:hypothetical protein
MPRLHVFRLNTNLDEQITPELKGSPYAVVNYKPLHDMEHNEDWEIDEIEVGDLIVVVLEFNATRGGVMLDEEIVQLYGLTNNRGVIWLFGGKLPELLDTFKKWDMVHDKTGLATWLDNIKHKK